jgi:hypothetical protein
LPKYLTPDEFFAGIVGEAEDYEVPGLGTIQIRPLTLMESRQLSQEHADDEVGLTIAAVQMAMVKPAMPAESVEKLQGAAAGKFMLIANRVMQLSGMADDSEKKVGGGS